MSCFDEFDYEAEACNHCNGDQLMHIVNCWYKYGRSDPDEEYMKRHEGQEYSPLVLILKFGLDLYSLLSHEDQEVAEMVDKAFNVYDNATDTLGDLVPGYTQIMNVCIQNRPGATGKELCSHWCDSIERHKEEQKVSNDREIDDLKDLLGE